MDCIYPEVQTEKNSIVRKRDYELITKPAIGENALKILKRKEELGFQRTTKNNNSRIRRNSVVRLGTA